MEDLEKKIADLEVQVQNQQETIEKLINYLEVDFLKSMENKIKITCPNCGKTGNYRIKPNYCPFCGKKIIDNRDE